LNEDQSAPEAGISVEADFEAHESDSRKGKLIEGHGRPSDNRPDQTLQSSRTGRLL
jgi:hypothetical protein